MALGVATVGNGDVTVSGATVGDVAIAVCATAIGDEVQVGHMGELEGASVGQDSRGIMKHERFTLASITAQ